MDALGAEVVLPLLPRSGPGALPRTSSLSKGKQKEKNDGTVLKRTVVAI